MAEFKYIPQWEGPLSGRSFEKQTEDAINAINQRIDEYVSPIAPWDIAPYGPLGAGRAGTSPLYARGDHQHPEQTSVPGNAAAAGRLISPVTLSLTGDASGQATFNGSEGSDPGVNLLVAVQDALPPGAVADGVELPDGRHGFMTAADKAKLDSFSPYPRIDDAAVENTGEIVSGADGTALLSGTGPTTLKVAVGHGLSGAVAVDEEHDGVFDGIALGVDAGALAGHGLLASSGTLGFDPAALATDEEPGLMAPADKGALAQAIVSLSADGSIISYERAGGGEGFIEVAGGGGGGGGDVDLSGLASKTEALARVDGDFTYSIEAPARYADDAQTAVVSATAYVIGAGEIVTSIAGWSTISNESDGTMGTDADGENPATPTTVIVTCGGTPGTEIPAGSRIKTGSVSLAFECSGVPGTRIPANRVLQDVSGISFRTLESVTIPASGTTPIMLSCSGPADTEVSIGLVTTDGNGNEYTCTQAGVLPTVYVYESTEAAGIPLTGSISLAFTCSGAPGAEIPANLLLHDASGFSLMTLESVVLDDEGTASIMLSCTGPAGSVVPDDLETSDDDGNVYTCASTEDEAGRTIPNTGTINVPFACTVAGAIPCPAGALWNGSRAVTQTTSAEMVLRANTTLSMSFSTDTLAIGDLDGFSHDPAHLGLSMQAIPGADDGAIASARLNGGILNMPARDLSSDSATLSGTADLYVAWNTPDASHVDGATSAFGTFTITWKRISLFHYELSITWNAPEGTVLLEPDAVLTLKETTVSGADSYREVNCSPVAKRVETVAKEASEAMSAASGVQDRLSALSASAIVDAKLSASAYTDPIMSVSPAHLAIDVSGGAELGSGTAAGLPVPETVDGTSAGDPQYMFPFTYKGSASSLTAVAGLGVTSGNRGETGIKAAANPRPTASVSADALPAAGESINVSMTGANPDGSTFALRITGVANDVEDGGDGSVGYDVSLLWMPHGSSQTADGSSVLPASVAIEAGTSELLFSTVNRVPADGSPASMGSFSYSDTAALDVYAVLAYVHPGEALVGTLANHCSLAAGSMAPLPAYGASSDYAMSGTCSNGTQTGSKLSLHLACTGSDLTDTASDTLGNVPTGGAQSRSIPFSITVPGLTLSGYSESLSAYAVLGELPGGQDAEPSGDVISEMAQHCYISAGEIDLPASPSEPAFTANMSGENPDGTGFTLEIACTGASTSDGITTYSYSATLSWETEGGTPETEGGASVLPAYLAICRGEWLQDEATASFASVLADGTPTAPAPFDVEAVTPDLSSYAAQLSAYAVLGGLAEGVPPSGNAINALEHHCYLDAGEISSLPMEASGSAFSESMHGTNPDGSSFTLKIACTGVSSDGENMTYDLAASLVWTPYGSSQTADGASVLPAYLALCTGDPDLRLYAASLAWIPPASPAPDTVGGDKHADIVLTTTTASGEVSTSTIDISGLVAFLNA